MKTEELLLKFISEDILLGKVDLTPATPLFSSNLLDSLSLVELIAFLDEEYQIKVSPAEIRFENFDTVERILKMMETKGYRHGA